MKFHVYEKMGNSHTANNTHHPALTDFNNLPYLHQRNQLPIFIFALTLHILGEGSFVSLPFYSSCLEWIHLYGCVGVRVV